MEAFKELALDNYTNEEDIKEYIFGIPYMMSPTTPNHSRIIINIFNKFDSILRNRRCTVFSDNTRYIIPKSVDQCTNRYYEPDVSIDCNPAVKRGRSSLISVPNLVVEVVSEESVIRDTMVKIKLYSKLGIKEYLVVSQEGIVNTYHLTSSGNYEVSTLSRGEVFKSRYIKDIEIEYDEIFMNLLDMSSIEVED